MLNPLYRRTAVAVTMLVTGVTTTRLRAQTTAIGRSPTQIHGVRQQRARYVTSQFFNLWASATSDGLVEVWSEPGRQAITVRPTDLMTIREFYSVEDIRDWTDSVETMLGATRPAAVAEPWRRIQTRPYLGRRLEARYTSDDATDRRVEIGLEGCPRAGTARLTLSPPALRAWIVALRAATEEARAIREASGPRQAPNPSAVYWYHAVGCPAEPLASNPAPPMPDVAVAERRPREVLAEFIVDSAGLVVAGSLRVPSGTDARFTTAVESVLPQWRFTPPVRAGRKVAQVVHVPVRFDPAVLPSTTSSCIDGPARGLVPRLASPNARTDQLPSAYLTSLARKLVTAATLPRPGSTIRFVIQRFAGITDIRVRAGNVDTPPDTGLARSFAILPTVLEPLPISYPDEALAVEMDVLAHCAPGSTVALQNWELRAAPRDDGLVQLSYVSLSDAAMGFREMPVWRDALDPRELLVWADSVEAHVARVDSAARARRRFGAEYIPGAPILGYPLGRGMRIGLTVSGALQGGVYCGIFDALLLITPEELPRVADLVRRTSREAIATRSQPVPGARVYAENEVACPAVPMPGNPRTQYPVGIPDGERSSHEVLVTLVVDTLGVPDSSTVHALPGTDARFAAAAERTITSWRFAPALRAGRRVRQAAHVQLLLRPDDADGAFTSVAVAGPVPVTHPPLGGLRPPAPPPATVFSRPPAQPRQSGRDASIDFRPEPDRDGVAALERLERAMQPYIQRARATYPAAKARFLAGLPQGSDFFVTARLRDSQGRSEQVFVAVDRIANGRIRGRIATSVRFVAGYKTMDPYELSETDVIDWTIVDAFGREEGNVVGTFLEQYRDPQSSPR